MPSRFVDVIDRELTQFLEVQKNSNTSKKDYSPKRHFSPFTPTKDYSPKRQFKILLTTV